MVRALWLMGEKTRLQSTATLLIGPSGINEAMFSGHTRREQTPHHLLRFLIVQNTVCGGYSVPFNNYFSQ